MTPKILLEYLCFQVFKRFAFIYIASLHENVFDVQAVTEAFCPRFSREAWNWNWSCPLQATAEHYNALTNFQDTLMKSKHGIIGLCVLTCCLSQACCFQKTNSRMHSASCLLKWDIRAQNKTDWEERFRLSTMAFVSCFVNLLCPVTSCKETTLWCYLPWCFEMCERWFLLPACLSTLWHFRESSLERFEWICSKAFFHETSFVGRGSQI